MTLAIEAVTRFPCGSGRDRLRASTSMEEYMKPGRNILWLVTFAAAAVTPAWGQVAAPTPTPAAATGATPGKASVPDFSGIWSHPYLTGFEIPFSGPGPVLNTSRSPNGVANFQRLVGDHANPILHQACSGGKQHIGRDGAQDDRVQLACFDATLFQSNPGRFHRQVGGRDIRIGNVPLGNSDALHDPLVAGLHQLFEILVGQDAGRRVAA